MSVGSVKQDKQRGTWFFVVDAPCEGLRQQIKRRGFKTRSAAVEAMHEMMSALAEGEGMPNAGVRSPVADSFGRVLRRRPELEQAAARSGCAPCPFEVWGSRDWLVQVYDDDGTIRLTVNRTTRRGDRWVDGITWDKLMQVKRDVGRGDMWAVEMYPADEHVVNDANMRHLFLIDEPPPYAWKNPS